MKIFLYTALALLLVLPLSAAAQFGPIVPEICQTCPCGFGGVLAIIQNLVNFIIGIAIIFATIIIVWGGGLYILSPVNPENRATANKMLMNAVIGLVIVLSAWLIVDFVMKTLYGGQFGPWNTILLGTEGQSCVVENENLSNLFDENIFSVPGGTGTNSTMPVDPTADERFSYQGGIQAQAGHASHALNNLLSCMASRVPASVGEISSISDSRIANNTKTFTQCVQGGCGHTANSCHYGGRNCTGSSYAVDFGDEQNMEVLSRAARACGADFVNPEGDHLHVSVGQSAGCSCN